MAGRWDEGREKGIGAGWMGARRGGWGWGWARADRTARCWLCTPGTPLKDAGSFLAPAVVSGMLAGGRQKEVTLVNALLLAQEAGLKVCAHPELHTPA